MDIGNIPFTLVVRAPNQRVADQTVEVQPQWTVKELKRHLSNVYPSQPGELQQKLIYSGKLMQDDKLLKEILTQHVQKQQEIEDKLQYIVHLVCSPSAESVKSDSSENVSSSSSVSDIHSSSSAEGLRHRTHVSSSPVVTDTSFVPGTAAPAQPALHNPMMAVPPMGPEMMAYTPEQYMFMMQNYYQQMASHYMQYYQTGALPVHPNAQMVHPNVQTAPPTHVEQQANQNQQDINAPREGAAANENMVMNAQGGMVEDDDDEFGQRDWLDYLYTFSRFMVLVTIVYFYSNFTRFLMVFAFFVVVYLYQTGWFVFRRREQAEPEQQQQPPQPQQQEQPQQEEQQIQEPQVQQEPQNNTENVQDDNSSEENVDNSPTQPEEAPKPGVIRTLWCFVSTFFTSLIPQQPEPVNLN